MVTWVVSSSVGVRVPWLHSATPRWSTTCSQVVLYPYPRWSCTPAPRLPQMGRRGTHPTNVWCQPLRFLSGLSQASLRPRGSMQKRELRMMWDWVRSWRFGPNLITGLHCSTCTTTTCVERHAHCLFAAGAAMPPLRQLGLLACPAVLVLW